MRATIALRPRKSSPLFDTHVTTSARFYRPSSPAADPGAAPISSAAAAASAPPSPPTTTPTEASPQTYFDYLDRMWSTKWFGTIDEQAAAAATTHAAATDPTLFAQAFVACQHALDVEAGTLIFLVGAVTRLCTLAFSLYGERAGERMRLALPELKKPQEEFNRVYYNDLASAVEVQVAASVLKSHRRAVFRKYSTSNWKCVASLATAPVIMTGLYQVSALCENAALDVGSSSFLWCGALALPDPFLVLPLLTCAVTLLNFELSISKEIKTGWMKNIIWGARLGCLCIIPVFATFRSGVCLYFIGMNVVGLLQPLLLRSAVFRQWFGFPAAAELSAAAAQPSSAASSPHAAEVSKSAKKKPKLSVSDRATTLRERIAAAVNPTHTSVVTGGRSAAAALPTQDVLQASMTVQFPYLSHLLNPQVEENAELFAKARNKQSKPDFGRRGPITSSAPLSSASAAAASAGSRYARGINPLMRETPLHRRHEGGAPSASGAAAVVVGGGGAAFFSSSRTSAEHGEKGEGRHTTAASPTSERLRVPKNKGSSFASSGWKSAQLSFDESDFIPNYDSQDASSKRK